MKDMHEYIKKTKGLLALHGVFLILVCIIVYLYELPAEAVIYGAVLCAIAGGASFFCGYRGYVKKKESIRYVKDNLPINFSALPEPADENEAMYQEMLRELNSQRMIAEDSKLRFYGDLTDYYTMWVHQIKTPIAAMRLLLSENDGENREALAELFKVEQYVEMVLGYLRTEDMSSDMKFREYSLDAIIREQIHKYARIFVGKKLELEYQGVEEIVLTDAKWLGFVIGQILSNALKYTKTGKISIYMCESRPHTLVIEDTGAGIRAEDLPRVFEKGFTGHNGREETRSTGIGLYLSAKIMKKLRHEIYIESKWGEGTKVYFSLGRKRLEMY